MKKRLELKDYPKLFWATFSLSAFTFGGGYVIVPLMKSKFVDKYHWIEEGEMLDMIALAQSSPGAMAINASILVGYRLAGFAGAFLTVLAAVLPPLVIITLISAFYESFRDSRYVAAALKGMQAGVSAVIASVVIKMAAGVIKQKRLLTLALMIGSLALALAKVNVALVILLAAVVGLVDTLASLRRKGADGK